MFADSSILKVAGKMSVPSYDPDLAEETGGWMSAEEMLRQADVTSENRGTKVAPRAKNSSSSRQHGKQKRIKF